MFRFCLNKKKFFSFNLNAEIEENIKQQKILTNRHRRREREGKYKLEIENFHCRGTQKQVSNNIQIPINFRISSIERKFDVKSSSLWGCYKKFAINSERELPLRAEKF
jgi:hypothetical protein